MMNYRIAGVEDAGLLGEMNKHLIEDEGHRNPMSVSELQNRLAEWLAGEYQAVIFVEQNDIRGYALFRHKADHIYLRHFFVCRNCRRAGVGRAALAWLHENVWKQSPVRIDVLTGNKPGIEFWRAVGFRDYSLTMELR
jgi:predicted acetyltransferase